MEKRTTDRKTTPAFHVHFRSALSRCPELDGTGILRDLSTFGCCIESAAPMIPDLSVTLHIDVPNWESPLTIKTARVQWVKGHTFGVGAFQTTEAEHHRLRQLILTIMSE